MPQSVDRLLRYCYAALSTVYLFTVGALSRKHRVLIGVIAQHFGYHRLGERPALPVVKLDELIGEDRHIQLRSCRAVEGNMTLAELVTIAQLVASTKPRRVFEIGTFDGRTTLAMADNADANAEVFTLDLPATEMSTTAFSVEEHEKHLIDKSESGARFKKHVDVRDRIHQLWGDSATYDYSSLLGTLDFVFVDGSHAYEYVLSDSENAFRLLGDRGVIVWHDFGEWPGVTRGLNELAVRDKRFNGIKSIKGTTLAVMYKQPAARV